MIDRDIQYRIKFYIPIIISIIIIFIVSLSEKSYDSEGLVTAYTLFGTISSLILFSIHSVLFIYTAFKKYEEKVMSYGSYICFIIYFSFVVSTLFRDPMVIIIASIGYLSALYMFGILVDMLINFILKNKIKKYELSDEDKELLRGKLPPRWYSRTDIKINQVMMILIIGSAPFAVIFTGNFLYAFIPFTAYFIVVSVLAIKQQIIIKNIVKKYENSLDIEYLSNTCAELREHNLHPHTLNSLNLLEIGYVMYHNIKLAEDKLHQINPKDKHLDQVKYQVTLIELYFLKGKHKECLDMINELLDNRFLDIVDYVNKLNNLKMRIEMISSFNPDLRVLDIIKKMKPTRLNNILIKYIQGEYAYYCRDYDKAKALFMEVVEDNNVLVTINNKVQKYLATIN